ncbi:MAG: ABC transporter permease [Nitrososphaerales archaeon]
MATDRITSRLALRNISRRKVTLLIVVLGLFIGTGMISGSLVSSDTFHTLFTRQGGIYGFGGVDEGIYHATVTGSYSFYNYSIYGQYSSSLASIPNVVGVTPMVISSVSIYDKNTLVGQPGVVLIGVYPNSSNVLGDFKDASGNVISSDIGTDGAIINNLAARDLNASVGDTIEIFTGQNSSSFVVKGIDTGFDRSGFPGGSDHVVILLSSAQALLDKPKQINFISITNSGGLDNSIVYTKQVGEKANTTLSQVQLGNNARLYAFGDKNASVVSLSSSAAGFTSILIITSTFTIIAGIVLIVNVFIMLAEERKKEMGMARAVGMKRRHLTKLFLFEGLQYSLISSIVGVAAGIGIAYVLLLVFGKILQTFVTYLTTQDIIGSFTIIPSTLAVSFAGGFLITYLTILFASWRVSRLSIIRAIRDTPDPPRPVRHYTWLLVLGLALIAVGAVSYLESGPTSDTTLFLLGPALLIFGIGLVLSRFVKNQIAFTASSLALLVYWSVPYISWSNPAIPPYGNNTAGPFLSGGIFMVISGVMLVAFNLGVISKALTLIFRSKAKWIPVIKTALSYPNNKRFRTIVTVFMFAIVMFTVILITVLTSINNTGINQAFTTESGGYDIAALSANPIHNLSTLVRSDPNVSSSVKSVIAFNGGEVQVNDLSQSNFPTYFDLYVGADANAPSADNFFLDNQYNMTNATATFLLPSGKVNIPKVWNDVETNPNDVVLATSPFSNNGPGASPESLIKPGDKIQFVLPNKTASLVNVIAIMNAFPLSGFVTTSQAISTNLQINSSSYALISLNNANQGNNVAISLKRDFLSYGLQVIVLRTLLNTVIQAQSSLFTILEGFLGLGLVVGIAGLSIVAVRSVVERRQEIGMMRALGFTKFMVLGSFFLENSFIALLGIVVGTGLALDLGNSLALFGNGFPVPYVIPWTSVIEICILVYFFAILGTIWSALRASKVPPAEALRYIE